MVGIKGIGGLPEPTPDRPANVRDRKGGAVEGSSKAKDEVLVSSEAQAAANVARIVSLANQQDDIRADKVAAAKEALARGDYQREDVVRVVAQRLSKYLP